MTRLTRLAAIAAIALVVGCREETLTLPAGPSTQITDAAHNSGNQHFFFLPPLVPSPQVSGVFDGSLAPVVQICVWTSNACASTVVEFTNTGDAGSETVRVDEADEHYIVNWHTNQFDLDPALTYRIRVLVAGAELGHADVDVVSSGSQLKNVNTNEFIPLKDGRTLPIKFRIEQGAVFLLDGDGGIVTSPDGNASILVPPGTVTTSTGFTVQPASIPAGEFGPEGLVPGTAYEFGPDGAVFPEPGVTVTLTYDPANIGGIAESDLVLLTPIDGKWAEVPNSTVNPVTHTVSADVGHFTVYTVGGSRFANIDEPFLTLIVGQTKQLSYHIGTNNTFLGWNTSPSGPAAVVSVSNPDGMVTALQPGSGRIRLTSKDPYYGLWTDEIFVTVLATAPPAGQLTWYRQREGVVGNDLYGIHGTSANDIFMVGVGGTILHWDGVNATRMNSGLTRTLRGVWARSSTDVYAVGPGAPGTGSAIIRYNGTPAPWPLVQIRTETTRSVTGNATHVFVAADDKVLRYDLANTPEPPVLTIPGTVIAVAAEGDSVIAVGEESGVGVVYRSNLNGDLGTWSGPVTPPNVFGQPASGPLTAAWRDPSNAFVAAVTTDGRTVMSGTEGATWIINQQLVNVVFRAVTSKPKPPFPFSRNPDVFVGGDYGELLWAERCRCGFGGNGFRGDQYVKQNILGMWTDSQNRVWGVGAAGLIFRQTSSSSHSFDVLARGQAYADVWVHPSGKVVAAAGAVHNQVWITTSYGAQWTEPSLLQNGSGFQGAFGAADGSEAYVVGRLGAIARVVPVPMGYSFTNLNSGTTQELFDVWVSPSGPGTIRPVYAAGRAGTVLRSADRGATWVPRGSTLSGQDLHQIFGVSDDTVFVTSSNGSIYRTTNGGLSWNPIRAVPGETFAGLWAASAKEIYAAGRETVGGVSQGIVVHTHNALDPSPTWFKEPHPAHRYLSGAWGDGAGMLVVVGPAGTVLVSNGHTSEPIIWTQQTIPPSTPALIPKDLFAVYGAVDPNTMQRMVFAVGAGGAIYTGVTQ